MRKAEQLVVLYIYKIKERESVYTSTLPPFLRLHITPATRYAIATSFLRRRESVCVRHEEGHRSAGWLVARGDNPYCLERDVGCDLGSY